MGTLAGLSRRLLPIGGSVQIASPRERCLSALESRGLDALLSIEPPTAPWRGKVEQKMCIRDSANATHWDKFNSSALAEGESPREAATPSHGGEAVSYTHLVERLRGNS